MSTFVASYLITLLALAQLVGLILLVREIKRLREAVECKRTLTLDVSGNVPAGMAMIVRPVSEPEAPR